MKERTELQSRINSLLFKTGEDDRNASQDTNSNQNDRQNEELKKEVAPLQLRKQQLQSEVQEWRDRLAKTKGELDALQKGMDDQRINFVRRWREITGEAEDDYGNETKGNSPGAEGNCNEVGAAKESDKVIIAKLEHKLQQALEGARRADVFRQHVSELNNMVESLQKQIEEWKEKYQNMQMQQKQNQATAALGLNRGFKTEGGDKKTVEIASPSAQGTKDSVNGSLLEKLQKDNRKMRKEISMQQASRDAQKSKVEQLRNERDTLAKTNLRVIQQSTEKEEINAEALSTILQLRQRLALHAQEKEEWDKKFKASQQLALASRLAATAKERLDEEIKKEKEVCALL